MPLVFPSTCPSVAYPLECVPVAAPYAMFMENGVKLLGLGLIKLQELGRQLYCRPGFARRDGSATPVPT
jgi:hypothetical protein